VADSGDRTAIMQCLEAAVQAGDRRAFLEQVELEVQDERDEIES